MVAVLIAPLCSVLVPTEATAYSTDTVSTWETAVQTLTMTDGLGITGAQAGGSYAEDPWDSGHGFVYRLHATSSPGAQIGLGG